MLPGVILLLTDCAVPPAPAGFALTEAAFKPAAVAPGPQSPAGGTEKLIAVTPLSAVTDDFQARPLTDRFGGAYTRLIVDSHVAPGGTNAGGVLPYQTRTLLGRFLFGKHSSLNLSVKVTTGSFTASVPLITLDHVSNSADGEVFNRQVNRSAQAYPLFLVRKDAGSGVVSVQFSLKASDATASAAAGTALSVATSVAKLVAPASAVITTLTQQSNQNAAAAVDQAINRLFSTSVDEETITDADIGHWQGAGGITVKLDIPGGEGNWIDTPVNTVGSWTVRFDDPRPSIFSDQRICDRAQDARCAGSSFPQAAAAAYAAASPAEVLAFPLINGAQSLGTVSSYLRQKDWFVAALGQFGGTVGPAAVALFCRNIRTSITEIGLNSVDADIVVNAVRKGMALPGTATALMGTVADCLSPYAA